ncbi:YitT family protein [Mangrovibacillus sp. Mu-81]|uniref:YitT family protein n=1 Tax=Mangrovibacillus sp. Mu-81 TaxID=3121478 RepID=UPI002FE4C88F
MNYIQKASVLASGSVIQGTAMSVFLFPHFIPSGGAASVSVLLNYLFHIPFSSTLLVLNAGLLIAAVKWLGKANALWTMFCVTITSITVDSISPYMITPLSNVALDLLSGAILFGIGLGLLFRMGASSGGMDILALILSKLQGYSPGRSLFVINSSLLVLTGIVVDWKIILYALFSQYIGTKILDLIYKFEVKKVSRWAEKMAK